ncbi:myb/SANT-like DNA-binding domain-containing protein 1 [Bactrocera oleae]|uniref:myb/SANT-like DNA-binding domain-containing protein 1 n=1 Tax=Bactrocera oleae TaxID=104688 RepID=UPI00387E7BFD
MKSEKMSSPKPKRKRLAWTEGAELAILELWAERVVELRGVRKNMHIYEKISEELAKLGYIYNAREVQVKLANFSQRYRIEKANLLESGETISSWPHYGRVHQIIGRFKVNSFSDSTLETIQAESSGASRLSPFVPPSTPASPVPSQPASPHASTSTPVTVRKKKKGVSQFQLKVLDKFEELSTEIIQYLRHSEENERQLIEVERQKAESLKKFSEVNREFKDAIIKFIQK